jgi:hypothetical protein
MNGEKDNAGTARKTLLEVVRSVVVNLTTALVLALVAILVSLFGFIWKKPFSATLDNPYVLGAIVYAAAVVIAILIALIWHSEVYPSLRRLYLEKRRVLVLKLSSSMVVPIPLIVVLVFLVSPEWSKNNDAEKLFPQAAVLGPVRMSSYATNGEVSYSFRDEAPQFGPNGFVTITFRTYGTTMDNNCGLVLFLLRGSDLREFKQLRFYIRGESGAERIGIKAKDANGVEVPLMLDQGPYLTEGTISTHWQEASVPFSHFGNVDFGLMDNFSFFTRGDLAKTIPQTIYVGGFRLLP